VTILFSFQNGDIKEEVIKMGVNGKITKKEYFVSVVLYNRVQFRLGYKHARKRAKSVQHDQKMKNAVESEGWGGK